ncbi:GNAT family N-acetyltransferase [Cohnella luojiensis]|uniref:GNAT family N-acetyltransferase n=1 Tax=Cohnella luojiensis TaxID=652876 RepID=A0A4Y8LPW8_9BACL|nr:GNAT family N-acetyltransferase [Cohnella luojiensis]TFE23322.1 GNAT family N-acetyltransferase [Cohnella luojiensis]
MNEIRLVKKEEMKDAVASADAIFRDSEMISMQSAFPFIFSADVSHSYGLFENERLLVFMGLVPANVQLGNARLSVFSLGSVYSVEAARNRGYAGEVLAEIKRYGRKAGASLLLVSGDGPLYARAGCRKFGEAYEFTLKRGFTESLTDIRKDYQFGEALHGDVLRLHEIAAGRYSAYEQSLWDFSVLIKTEADISGKKMKQRVYAAKQNGIPVAFVVMGLPEGSPEAAPVVVEWAGEAVAVLSLLSYVMTEADLEQVSITVSGHEKELIGELRLIPAEKKRNQGTVYIFDAERLFDQLRPYFAEIDPTAATSLSIANAVDSGAILTLPGLPEAELTHEELVSLLFDPEPETRLSEEWKEATARRFPLPFPYTNGLNFV